MEFYPIITHYKFYFVKCNKLYYHVLCTIVLIVYFGLVLVSLHWIFKGLYSCSEFSFCNSIELFKLSSIRDVTIGDEGEMAGVLGRLHEFDATLEPWEQYVERLGHFLDANGITNIDKKRSVLLSAIGPAPYKLLTSLLSPQKPGEKSYKELVTLSTEHYNPAPSEIVERYKFHTRIRHEGETVSTFVAELRSLARYCKFGASLNDLLRDRIVCGINDENIQRRLLAEKTLTMDSAMDIVVGMESARKNVTELQTPARKPTDVYKVTTTNCYRCGNSGHVPDRCRFRDVKCLTCGKTGHIQRMCRSGPQRSDRLPVETEKSTSKSRRNHRP